MSNEIQTKRHDLVFKLFFLPFFKEKTLNMQLPSRSRLNSCRNTTNSLSAPVFLELLSPTLCSLLFCSLIMKVESKEWQQCHAGPETANELEGERSITGEKVSWSRVWSWFPLWSGFLLAQHLSFAVERKVNSCHWVAQTPPPPSPPSCPRKKSNLAKFLGVRGGGG